MTGDRFQDLWTRNLDGQQLSPDEAADLARAFIDETDLRTSLVRDAEMHDLLNTTARLSRGDDEVFVRAVMTRLDARAAAADLEPVPPPRHTSSLQGWSEPEPPPIQLGARVKLLDAAPSSASLAPASASTRAGVAGRRARSTRTAWLALAVASVVAVVVLVAVLFVGPRWKSARLGDATLAERDRELRATPVSPDVPGRANPRGDEADRRLVEGKTLPGDSNASPSTAIQPVVWRKGGPRGERIEPGVHELAQGTVRVRTPDDHEVELVAPTLLDFADPQTLDLRRGLVRVRHLNAAPAIRLLTPLSEIKEFEGTAELHVADEGETEIVIHDGRLTFVERFARQSEPQVVTLVSTDYDRARVYAPVREATAQGPTENMSELAATELFGPDQRFLGQIAVDGQVLEFGSPATFAEIRRQAEARFQQTPVEFVQAWNQMVQQLQTVGNAPAKLQVNGRRVEARTGDAIFGFQMSSGTGTDREEGEGFEGIIMVNGELRSFKSKADFDAAQKEMMKRLP